MSRLECLGKSFTGSQKKSAEVTSSHNEKPKNIDKVGGKAGPDKLWSPPAPPCSVQVSRHKGQKSELPSGDMLNEDGRRRHDVRPEVKHHQANEGEEGDEDEDIKVPVELKMEFLRAVIKRDLKLACKLCQMTNGVSSLLNPVLIYEPENPEASNFLPLIKKKLLEEQEAKQSSEEDDDDDDDDSDDSGSDEELSHSSSGSSPSDDDDDDSEEKQVHRHKRCPSENDT
ncbi:glutamate-rich protein 2 isoform X2 [Labrus bergylta]|uniref:glutamate-rich protein 2 isoform X2 n=1 Tax=Labrus bergylta TaxID=56723 RepID=UPI0033144248